jgi:hypothetical protein
MSINFPPIAKRLFVCYAGRNIDPLSSSAGAGVTNKEFIMEFDFSNWLQTSAGLALGVLPVVFAVTKGAELFGLAGKAQAAFAVVVSLVLGTGLQIGVFGVPENFLGWFLLAVFGLIVAGEAIGTYETAKHAARKANGG